MAFRPICTWCLRRMQLTHASNKEPQTPPEVSQGISPPLRPNPKDSGLSMLQSLGSRQAKRLTEIDSVIRSLARACRCFTSLPNSSRQTHEAEPRGRHPAVIAPPQTMKYFSPPSSFQALAKRKRLPRGQVQKSIKDVKVTAELALRETTHVIVPRKLAKHRPHR